MAELEGIDKQVAMWKSRKTALDTDRSPYIQLWTDIRNFLAPRSARLPGEQVNDPARQDLYMLNCSPRFAGRTLAYGLQSGVTSPMRPWFSLGTPDDDLNKFLPVKMWLYEVKRRMLTVFATSNVYSRLQSNYFVLGNYGTSGFGIDEDDDEVIRAYDYPMGSFSIASSATGRIHTIYRDLNITALQIIERWGRGKHKAADTAYDTSNYDVRFPIVHVMEPNRQFKPGSALSKYKRYASAYLNTSQSGSEAVLSLKGYDMQPFSCPRWDVVGEDDWGFGCGETALGDSKQTQLMEKRKLQKLDKNVNPTMLADSSMRNTRTSNVPGDTVYVNGLITGKPGYQPAYMVDGAIEQVTNEIMRVEQRIDEAFFKNLFLMVAEIGEQPNITATQINALREEKLLMLGPVLSRLDTELLNPLISQTFAIMWRRGMLPPPPKEIQGMPLKVRYTSILAQAQRAIGVQSIERFIGQVGTLAQMTGDMSPLDKINKDAVVDELADSGDMPPTLLNSEEVVAEIRQGRAQQQAAAQAAQMGLAAAKGAKDLAGADTGSDNALTRVTGIQGATAAA